MKLSDYLVRYIYAQGVTSVFELSGGMIAHFIDSLYSFGKIDVITMHHEQSAAFAADGFARIKGFPGVAFASSGPGATNLLTGIGSCYFDSVPAVFITGQVNQHEQRGNRPIRQLGFQETDVVEMAKPICKSVFVLETAEQLPEILKMAFETAISGRPGPVLIDIPMNLQRANIEFGEISIVKPIYNNLTELNDLLWNQLKESINKANKPLILVGRGVLSSFSRPEFLEFAEITGIPVISSLLATDAIPFNHPLRVGFIGAYGNRWANMSIGSCDLMIVIGSRLDIRQTGAHVESFSDRVIYHIDIEVAEINNRIKGCIPIVHDIKGFLKAGISKFKNVSFTSYIDWYKEIQKLKNEWPDVNEVVDLKGINPNAFLHKLSKFSMKAGAYIADVGNHQMWAAQSLELLTNQYFITTGGMGAMGYAVPASIGVCVALKKPVVIISGDGGFQLNIQELQTIIRNKLPIKIVIINNRSLGMIRQFQDSYFNSNYQSTMWGYDAPDFEKVAIAYGIQASTVQYSTEIEEGLIKLWEDENCPFLLQVMIDPATNAYPKLAFGKPITEMEPFSKPLEMEGT